MSKLVYPGVVCTVFPLSMLLYYGLNALGAHPILSTVMSGVWSLGFSAFLTVLVLRILR